MACQTAHIADSAKAVLQIIKGQWR